MQVRCCVRYVKPGDRLSLTRLWEEGRTDMDLAYNAATARPIDYTFALDDAEMVFFFVVGRGSLIQFFAKRENQRLFLPLRTSGIGLITQRQKYFLRKDKTVVGVCNTQLRCDYPVRPLADFVGGEGVLPLDTDGGRLTSAQLASILRSIYRNPQQDLRELGKFLHEINPW